jgi:hypothetical protein
MNQGARMDPGSVKVTKREAASRQLNQGIRLFFDRGDMLAVHTLTAAAFQLFADLGQVSWPEPSTSPL